jgi:hypothetical protein
MYTCAKQVVGMVIFFKLSVRMLQLALHGHLAVIQRCATRADGKASEKHLASVSQIHLFRFVILPSSTYLFTVGVERFYFHLITLQYTPRSVGLLWTTDRPVAETST